MVESQKVFMENLQNLKLNRMKEQAAEKLNDMIDEGSVNLEMIQKALFNWMSGSELNEFVEFLEDELGY